MANGNRLSMSYSRRFLAIGLAALGLFVVSYGIGLGNPGLIAVGVAIGVLGPALLVFTAVRATGRQYIYGTAHVYSASPPPSSGMVGRCELHLSVFAAGIDGVAVRVLDPAVPVSKWPDDGATLPVEVVANNPRKVRVLWDKVVTHAQASGEDLYPQYVEDLPPEDDEFDDDLPDDEYLDDDLPPVPAGPPPTPPPNMPTGTSSTIAAANTDFAPVSAPLLVSPAATPPPGSPTTKVVATSVPVEAVRPSSSASTLSQAQGDRRERARLEQPDGEPGAFGPDVRAERDRRNRAYVSETYDPDDDEIPEYWRDPDDSDEPEPHSATSGSPTPVRPTAAGSSTPAGSTSYADPDAGSTPQPRSAAYADDDAQPRSAAYANDDAQPRSAAYANDDAQPRSAAYAGDDARPDAPTGSDASTSSDASRVAVWPSRHPDTDAPSTADPERPARSGRPGRDDSDRPASSTWAGDRDSDDIDHPDRSSRPDDTDDTDGPHRPAGSGWASRRGGPDDLDDPDDPDGPGRADGPGAPGAGSSGGGGPAADGPGTGGPGTGGPAGDGGGGGPAGGGGGGGPAGGGGSGGGGPAGGGGGGGLAATAEAGGPAVSLPLPRRRPSPHLRRPSPRQRKASDTESNEPRATASGGINPVYVAEAPSEPPPDWPLSPQPPQSQPDPQPVRPESRPEPDYTEVVSGTVEAGSNGYNSGGYGDVLTGSIVDDHAYSDRSETDRMTFDRGSFRVLEVDIPDSGPNGYGPGRPATSSDDPFNVVPLRVDRAGAAASNGTSPKNDQRTPADGPDPDAGRATDRATDPDPEPDDGPTAAADTDHQEEPADKEEPAEAEAFASEGDTYLAAPSAGLSSLGSGGFSVTLFVRELSRSVAFYRDVLGLPEVDTGKSSAVLARGESRILLKRVTDLQPVDRRVVHLNLEVPDVQAAYDDLKAKGVEFVHRPRVVSHGEQLELWAATFRDPDGHAIALTHWEIRR